MDDDYAWEADARCRKLGLDPNLFFPEADARSWLEAVTHCRACPVSRQCYDSAASRRERVGVWGGVNFGSRETARLVQARNMAPHWAECAPTPTVTRPEPEAKPAATAVQLPTGRRGPRPQHGTQHAYYTRRCRCVECVAYHDDRIARQRARRADARTQRPTTKTTAVVIDIDTRRRHAAADAMDLTGS